MSENTKGAFDDFVETGKPTKEQWECGSVVLNGNDGRVFRVYLPHDKAVERLAKQKQKES